MVLASSRNVSSSFLPAVLEADSLKSPLLLVWMTSTLPLSSGEDCSRYSATSSQFFVSSVMTNRMAFFSHLVVHRIGPMPLCDAQIDIVFVFVDIL